MPRHRPNPPSRGACRRKSRNASNVVTNGSPPNGFLVPERLPPQRSVDDQIDLSGLYQIHNVRPAFIYFVNRLNLDPRASQRRCGTSCAHHLQARSQKVLNNKREMPLVVIVHAEKYGSLKRQPLPCCELRLRESQSKR